MSARSGDPGVLRPGVVQPLLVVPHDGDSAACSCASPDGNISLLSDSTISVAVTRMPVPCTDRTSSWRGCCPEIVTVQLAPDPEWPQGILPGSFLPRGADSAVYCSALLRW
ncbi:hypothetical protein NDU88_001331 [Pleurodeles waltl]|uniref:Uncharacterized protein n=1 Tax=Pleurodeles waltl TaxID=8319 RepID=A0AAV7S9T7_PLEWA|nr:hypothetical protein NDU88_001331 [Pleurodeles waltl]